MALSSINPSSGDVLESFEEATPAALERVLAHAWQAFLGWRECTFAERAARLREVARVLGAKKVEYARLMALEMGKPVAQGEAEVEKCAPGARWRSAPGASSRRRCSNWAAAIRSSSSRTRTYRARPGPPPRPGS